MKVVDALMGFVNGEIFMPNEKYSADFQALINGLNDKEWQTLYALSKTHDLSHVVGAGIGKIEAVVPNELKEKLKNDLAKSVFRYERLNYSYLKVIEQFERANIDFVPLKGAIMREYYPAKHLRTSCDIDLLVKKSDLDIAQSILVKECGCKRVTASEYDVNFITLNDTHIELHFDIIDKRSSLKVKEVLKNVWDYTENAKGYSHFKKLQDDIFVLYHVVHMCKHFLGGGCGIRPFIDLWLLEKNGLLDSVKLNEILTKTELLQFYENMLAVCKVWFNGEKASELIGRVEKYVILGGVYGTFDNKVQVNQNREGGKIKYFIKRVFLPYRYLRHQYPILKKHKWLTPVMQIARWFRVIFTGRVGASFGELNKNAHVSKEQLDRAERMLSDIGL